MKWKRKFLSVCRWWRQHEEICCLFYFSLLFFRVSAATVKQVASIPISINSFHMTCDLWAGAIKRKNYARNWVSEASRKYFVVSFGDERDLYRLPKTKRNDSTMRRHDESAKRGFSWKASLEKENSKANKKSRHWPTFHDAPSIIFPSRFLINLRARVKCTNANCIDTARIQWWMTTMGRHKQPWKMRS